MRRRVAKGPAAKQRRYESAVRRQIELIANAYEKNLSYWYAEPAAVLRRGDDLDRFLQAFVEGAADA